MPSSTQLQCQPVKIQVFLDLYAKQIIQRFSSHFRTFNRKIQTFIRIAKYF